MSVIARMPIVPSARSRSTRWTALRDLLTQLDALTAQNIRIDTLSHTGNAVVTEVVEFEKALERTRQILRYEINRLTADSLRSDLAVKMKKDKDGRA